MEHTSQWKKRMTTSNPCPSISLGQGPVHRRAGKRVGRLRAVAPAAVVWRAGGQEKGGVGHAASAAAAAAAAVGLDPLHLAVDVGAGAGLGGAAGGCPGRPGPPLPPLQQPPAPLHALRAPPRPLQT
eukprot:scaffold47241_cov19-Tisochrysis_lutea.AAC.2